MKPKDNASFRVALVTPGGKDWQRAHLIAMGLFYPTLEALREAGLEPELVHYTEDLGRNVRHLLLGFDAVLVCVNPINRSALDMALREIAGAGVLVSAHPDIIQKMSPKEVLYQTRDMSWGCDTHLYCSPEELREQLPLRLKEGRARVLKQNRGNGGNGVWKVERHPTDPDLVRVRHALRGSPEQEMRIDAFLAQCEGYFENGGRIIDQAYQERLFEGMIRCYLVQDKVAGFGYQEINLLFPTLPGETPPSPTTRLYTPPSDPRFEAIKAKMENEWLGELCQRLEIDPQSLPLIWEAAFLFGPKTESGEDTYVLCEINVSAVYPLHYALEPLAKATKEALLSRSQGGASPGN